MSKIKTALSAMVRPLVEPQLPPELEVTWFGSVDEAKLIAPTAEIGWFDMYDKGQMGQIIQSATNLKWLNSLYAGVEHFPLQQLKAQGTILTNGAGINASPIAEYVVMGMLAAAKRFDKVAAAQADHIWLDQPPGATEITGAKVLIIGYGAIGQQVAKKLAGFDMQITAVRRSASDDPNVLGPGEWRARLKEFDWIIIAAPATDETKAMIGADELAAMKSSAWIVNIARGTLVDQTALMAALQSKAIGGAFLDVTDPEPLPVDHPLWDAPNALITMHLSGLSQQYMFQRGAERFIANLKQFLARKPMIAVVDPDRGY